MLSSENRCHFLWWKRFESNQRFLAKKMISVFWREEKIIYMKSNSLWCTLFYKNKQSSAYLIYFCELDFCHAVFGFIFLRYSKIHLFYILIEEFTFFLFFFEFGFVYWTCFSFYLKPTADNNNSTFLYFALPLLNNFLSKINK